jgi:hypothetical protein
MSRRRIIRAVRFAILAVSLTGSRAAHAEVALGASFGYTHCSYTATPAFTNDVFGIPGSGEWGQPGIRVGYVAPSRLWDLNADVGFVHVSRNGTATDETTVEAVPQLQVNARGWGGLSPFVNGGAGVVHETVLTAYGNSIRATRPVFGAGIGVRKPVSEGHGFVRVELRYDHLPERVTELNASDSFTFLATDRFSVKLGFDLLVAR